MDPKKSGINMEILKYSFESSAVQIVIANLLPNKYVWQQQHLTLNVIFLRNIFKHEGGGWGWRPIWPI